jgi:hypothetical protein
MTIQNLCTAYQRQTAERNALQEQTTVLVRRIEDLQRTWIEMIIHPLGALIAKYFKHRAKNGYYAVKIPLYPVHVNYGGPFGLCARATIEVKRKSNVLFAASFETRDLSTEHPRLLVVDWNRPIPVAEQYPANSVEAINRIGQPTIDVTNWSVPKLIRWAQTQTRAERRRA